VAEYGFLGLGVMGAAMAGRLVAAGHDVVVWNRTASAADELVAAGARRAATPADALGAEVSYSMLANDEAAHEVLSAGNLASATGRSHISMASLSPEAVARIADRAREAGVRFAAAPVTGRPPVAAAGQLNILAAGDPRALAAAAAGFDAMGKKVWPLGDDPRRAAVVKIAVNYNIIHAIQALGESIALVETHGVAAADFAELLTGTLFGGLAHTGYAAEIANRDYRPAGFSMALGRKDLGLAEDLAADAGFELPTSAVIRALFDEALADPELAEDDWGALAEITRRRAQRT
jgi:3-hydroxyisobutyrate dehydrogenase-like beta-hydroxyacid dehydrogenase